MLEAITKRAKGPTPAQPRSWASIVSGTTGQSGGGAVWEPRKVVPARHAREVVIKTKGCTPPQSAAEVVSRVNTALRSSEALAARQLQSGDIVVLFKNNAEAHTQDSSWVKAAFGDQATLARRTYAVLAKGIPRGSIERRAEDDTKAEIEKVNKVQVARCRTRLPKSKEAKYGALLIEVESVAAAQQMCSQGIVLEAQIFNCEPYSRELQISQCYNCHAYGHLAKACTRRARCGYCGKEAHEKGDSHCPERGAGTPSCINCQGQHTAWDRRCPAARTEKQRIKDAYAHRPRQFVVGGSDVSWSTATSGSSAGTSLHTSGTDLRTGNGFQTVAPKKRKIGRPRDLDRPEQGNRRVDEAFTRRQSIAVSTQDSRSVVAATQNDREQTLDHTDEAW
jgi:hypothetical protein